MKRSKIYLLLLVIAALLVVPFFVFAENVGGNSQEIDILNQKIAQKKQMVQQLEKSIEEYKKAVIQKQLEAVSLKNQLSIMNDRIKQAELDIEATKEKMDSLTLEIEALQLSITDKESTLSRQREILAGLIRTIYFSDGKDYLEIAAAYDNFSEFYNQVQNIQSIQRDLGRSVSTLRTLKEDLQTKKQQTEERKQAYEKLKQDLEQKKLAWQDQQNYKSGVLKQTKGEESKFQTMLNNLRAQYQQIESEINAIEREVRQKLEGQKKLSNLTGDPNSLSWPVQSHVITAYFHDPEYPYRYVFEHTGVDIRAGQGTPVKATASGYVAQAKVCSSASCYSYVMLIHTDGIATVYGHLSKVMVKGDQFVARGDVVGYSGGTPGTAGAGPFVTGPHLHFEVRKNGIPVNPLQYLQ